MKLRDHGFDSFRTCHLQHCQLYQQQRLVPHYPKIVQAEFGCQEGIWNEIWKKNQLPKKLALAVLFLSSCSSSSCGSFAISQITSSEDWNYFPISNWNTFLFLIDFFFSIWKYLGIFSLFRNVCYLFFHDISKNHFLLADMEQNAVLVK